MSKEVDRLIAVARDNRQGDRSAAMISVAYISMDSGSPDPVRCYGI